MLRSLFLLTLTLAGCAAPGAGSATIPGRDTLTIATYNIRHGRGMDGVVELSRTGNAIARLGADIVALQEVDRHVERSGHIDEPRLLQEF